MQDGPVALLPREILSLPSANGRPIDLRIHRRSTRERSPRRFLLVHGNPGAIDDWARVIDRLAAIGEVVAIDLPGFGETPSPSDVSGLSLDAFAEVVRLAAVALEWNEPFCVVGHSHGGAVAQTFAARYPDRAGTIVAVATLGHPTHGSYRTMAFPGVRTLLRAARILFDPPGRIARTAVRTSMRQIFWPRPVPESWLERELALFHARPEVLLNMAQLAQGAPSEQLHRNASRIRCPSLFVHGARDALVPVRCARSIHARIESAGGRSRFVELSDAGHMIPEYESDELVGCIEQFLGDVDRRS